MQFSEIVPGTQALTKGILVLRAIAAEGRGAKLPALMAATAFPKPTLYRILKALLSEGLVRQDPEDGSYHLGKSFLSLAFQALDKLDVRSVARPELLQLRDAVQEAVHLAVIDGTEAVYIDLVETSHPVGPVGRLGSTNSIHSSASGKSIAAFLSQDARLRVLADLKMTAFTRTTITTMADLVDELERVRVQGFAEHNQEEVEGIHGIAAPIFDWTGNVVASVGISIPSFRFDAEKVSYYAKETIEAASRISDKLGTVKPR